MSIIDDVKSKLKDTLSKHTSANPNNPEESSFLSTIINDQTRAEGTRDDIERIWDDEYKMYVGDQWSTTFAYRSPTAKKIRPNSVDNFVMPAVINIHSALTASTPEMTPEPRAEDDREVAEKLKPVIDFVCYKNRFPYIWKKTVLRGLQYGPIIGAVLWDNSWIGGTGPNRWIGDIRLLNVKRKEFYPDPAIVDLEERLQECGFIHRKLRRKIDYFRQRWEDKGQFVEPDDDIDDEENEGSESTQATLIERWHRGKPKFIPEEWQKEFKQKATEAEMTDPYKADRYLRMANGELDGIHVAYCTRDVFLEYIPYMYDDGLYPFVYKVMYEDEKSPYGFGEIRNIKIPQVMHNKADEIEIEAMSVEGLGGCYYNKGAMSPQQQQTYLTQNAKGGAAIEVMDIGGIKERIGPKIPASITNYKDHKQRMIETISQNTPIMQGQSPGGVKAWGAIRDLGERADTRNRGKVEILEDFLVDFGQLIISRIAQFYTEERQWRITGSDGASQSGTFSNSEMKKTWEREPAGTDAEGNPTPAKQEEYVPEMDLRVKVIDERPTSRDFYVQNAMQLLPMKAIDIESFWYTMEEGKFPPKEEILKRLAEMNQPPPPPPGGPPQGPMPGQQPPPQQGAPQGAPGGQPPQLAPEIAQAIAQNPQLQQALQALPPQVLAAFLSAPPEQQVEMLAQLNQQVQGGNGGQMQG